MTSLFCFVENGDVFVFSHKNYWHHWIVRLSGTIWWIHFWKKKCYVPDSPFYRKKNTSITYNQFFLIALYSLGQGVEPGEVWGPQNVVLWLVGPQLPIQAAKKLNHNGTTASFDVGMIYTQHWDNCIIWRKKNSQYWDYILS